MTSTLIAVCRISYDRATDQIEVMGHRTTGALPQAIGASGYAVLSRTVIGWGDDDAMISCDGFGLAVGTFLAKFAESETA